MTVDVANPGAAGGVPVDPRPAQPVAPSMASPATSATKSLSKRFRCPMKCPLLREDSVRRRASFSIYGDNADLDDTPDDVFTEEVWNTSSSLTHQPYPYRPNAGPFPDQTLFRSNRAFIHRRGQTVCLVPR